MILLSGSSFVLFDNLWGTNYVEWWPFQVTAPPSPALLLMMTCPAPTPDADMLGITSRGDVPDVWFGDW